MSMQDTASGVALWRQVADGIERGIADGRFAAGEKLPGEMEIAETYRVNRHTVRRALATLAERGLVRAERGSGTYVETRRIAYPLRSRTRFSEIVGAGGQEPRGQLIDTSEDVATRELARELGLKTGAPLIPSHGALDATLDLAADYAASAKAALAEFGPGNSWRPALEDLADFAVARRT